MRESEHFNLFLAEGSDIVNPLVQDVQNYVVIDEQMFKNQNSGVQNATELKNGTVHAITRNVPDAQFITFTATSNYTAGETFTVDGVQVSALTVSGETLPTGAYVINSQVLCVLKGTLLTVYGVGSEVADNSLALNGHPDTYFGTKEDVDNAIDTANAAKELANDVNNSLSSLIIQSVVISKNGNYGYLKDCIGSVCYKNKTAFLHIEGEISGTVDLFFTDFGLSPNLKTPMGIYGDATTSQYKALAITEDEHKNTLYVRVRSNSTGLQLSVTGTGFYGVTFAVTFA